MKLFLTIVALFGLFNVNTLGAFGASNTSGASGAVNTSGAFGAVNTSDAVGAMECGKVRVLLNKGKKKKESTLEGQWPWEVAVYQTVPKHRFICGGTLVSKRHVITAAHCVTTQQGQLDKSSPVQVYLGKYNIEDFGEKVQNGTLKDIRLHPEFNATIFNRNFAIMELQDPVTFSNWVQPACLWPDSDIELKNIVGKIGTVVGWPYTDKIDKLQLLETPVVSQEACYNSYPKFFRPFTSNSTYCAGSGCIASGHGMVFKKDGRWHLRGVVTLTVAKENEYHCDPIPFTIFADVAQALPWIKENIKEN